MHTVSLTQVKSSVATLRLLLRVPCGVGLRLADGLIDAVEVVEIEVDESEVDESEVEETEAVGSEVESEVVGGLGVGMSSQIFYK